jgi:hypothetical protein
MKKSSILLILILLLLTAQSSFTQTWNALLNLNPYPSPYASDWEINPGALGSLTVFNNSGREETIIIKATVSQEGRGEVFRSTIKPIDIASDPVTVLSNTKLFSLSDASFSDNEYERILRLTGRLLEGYYTACLSIENLDGTILITNVCANFTILYPEPPQLIFPQDEDSVLSTTTYPTFQWTPVITPPAYQVTYTLKICEVLEGQTPSQALNANYPHYLNNQLTISSLTYPIEGLPFDPGKKYVWQIQALDQYGFPPAQNQGKSEIFTFVKKSNTIIFPILTLSYPLLQSPTNNSVVQTKKPEFSWYYTPGQGEQINYRIKICKMNSGQTPAQAINNISTFINILDGTNLNYTPQVPLNFVKNNSYVWRIDILDQNNSLLKSSEVWKFTYNEPGGIIGEPGEINFPSWCFLSGQLHYKYGYQYDMEHWQLPTKTIKLVQMYVLKYNSHTGDITASHIEAPPGTVVLEDGDLPPGLKDNNKILAVTTSDAAGNFQFNFISPDSMGLVKTNYTISYGAGEIGHYTYSGDVYRVARIIVEDQYFTSPDEDIIIQPWETKNIGIVTSALKSFAFEVTIKPDPNFEDQFTHQDIPEMDVYILRKYRPFNLPKNEGSPRPNNYTTLFGYEVVGKGTTEGPGGNFGKIIFTRLVSNISPGDAYYLYAVSNENAPHKYVAFLGKFTFSYSHRELDKYHYHLPDQSDNINIFYRTDEGNSGGGIKNTNVSEMSVFNTQYIHPVVHRTFYAFPLLPEISGTVVRSDETGTKINGASILLMNIKTIDLGYGGTYSYPVVEKSYTTNATGKFKFSNLPVEKNPGPPHEINGPVRSLWVSAPGFSLNLQNVQGGAANHALTLAEKWSKVIQLNPGSIVSGNIIDENGNGIVARIKIGESPEKTVYPSIMFFNQQTKKWIIGPSHFEFPVAKLNNQPMIVTPVYNASQYIVDTTHVNITQSNQNLGNIIVYKKLHRLKFIVKESQPFVPTIEHPNPPVYQWPVLPGARVKINILGSYEEKTTNSVGIAEFEFANDADSFKVIVEGPVGQYYVKKAGTIFNKPSKYETPYIIVLDKATYISGSVYVAGNQYVQGADVWIDFGNPDLNISVKTDEIGEYILPNVPIGESVIVYGSKHSDEETIIGDSAFVFTTAAGKTGVDLHLTIYNGMDITKLLGFPVLLTGLNEEPNGDVKIEGKINQLKNNSVFKPFDPTTSVLNFADVPIKPGSTLNSKGIPFAELSNPPLVFDDPSLSLKVFDKFSAEVGDPQKGIQLSDAGNGNGVVGGKTFIPASSFNTQGSLSNYSGLYLMDPNEKNISEKLIVPAITADGSVPVNIPKGFNVGNQNGNGITFKLNGFNSDSDPLNSYFNKDTVRLRTTLHTNIQYATPSDLKLEIDDVVFHQVGIEPIVSSKSFLFKLDNWTLNASKWILNQGNLVINEGTLNAGVNVPIKTLDIKPTSFGFADFDFTSMMVSGVVPLTITGKINFGHDDANSYWYLSLSKKNLTDEYAAYFKDLPGMEQNIPIKVIGFELNSKESFFKLSPAPGQLLKIYKVGLLSLGNAGDLSAYEDYLYIPGLGFDIPNVTQSTAIQYYKDSNNKIAFRMSGININTNAGNGVYMKFGVNEQQQNSQVLDDWGFRSWGVVGEAGKFEKYCWLFHTIDSTSVLIETPYTPYTTRQNYQKMAVGSESTTYLATLTGGMKAGNNKWNNFHFAGDLTGTKGITDDNKHLAFTVYGEIKADNQKISVKNVPTPFGGMDWFYDFENSRLTGTFDIHQNMGGIKINGTSEIVVDGSGWYFLGGGTLEVPGIGPGYAATLFGDYPTLPQSVKTKFAQASYNKNLPASFQKNISGFLFSGAASVPVIIPHFNLDLGIFALGFGIDAGADIKVYKGFDEGGSTYGIGALGFIHAFLTMQSITCTTLSGDATLEAGVEGSYQTGSGTFNLDGCTSFSIGGHIIQKFYGCDLDGCGCTYTLIDIGDDFAFGALLHLDSGGNMSLGFKKGSCSGN